MVIIIVLNLIFGVIIDTFADLRSEKQKKEEILKTTCFICGEGRTLLFCRVMLHNALKTNEILPTQHTLVCQIMGMWVMTFDISFPVFFPSLVWSRRAPFLECNKAETSSASCSRYSRCCWWARLAQQNPKVWTPGLADDDDDDDSIMRNQTSGLLLCLLEHATAMMQLHIRALQTGGCFSG